MQKHLFYFVGGGGIVFAIDQRIFGGVFCHNQLSHNVLGMKDGSPHKNVALSRLFRITQVIYKYNYAYDH